KAIETDHLDVTGIFADVGIVKGTSFVRLVQSKPVHYVVEDHGNPDAANLQRCASAIGHSETKYEIALVNGPCPNQFQRRGRWQARGHIRREVASVGTQNGSLFAMKGCRYIGPARRSGSA